MLEPSLHGNRVEALAHLIETSDHLDAVLLLDFRFDDRRSSKNAQAGLAKDGEEGAVFKFSNDGKDLLMTLGVRDEPGNDDKHFKRPTDIAWLPDGKRIMTLSGVGDIFIWDVAQVLKR